jgi:TonB-dependent receptor
LDSNFIANGSNGNASLVPLESTNIDLSLEWYYDDVSYVSVGYYRKDVENFLGSGQVQETAFGLRDVSNGPRAQQALRELEEKGYAITDTNLFSYVAWLDQGGEASGIEFDSLIADVEAINATERDYDILPNSDDPEMLFRITKQLNTNDASVYGMEFAIQHFFGDSGFGVQANYTTVDGDVDYDVTKGQDSNQFALTGLSDTANLVGLYEKDNLQVRVAYNWRDTFLEGAGVNPTFVEDYSQIDIGASYSVSENLTVYLDAINVTDEDSRKYRRSVTELVNFAQNGARYAFGARYTF